MPKKISRTSNKNYQARYARYKAENRVYKNAVARLERHMKNYPNDEQAQKRLVEIKKDGRPYKRNNTKTSHVWSSTDIFLAELCNIKLQLPVVNRKADLPEWKQKLAQAFGRS